uniref:Transmembrane protein n=1 Tax=Trypanosoma vivax (strain Y486) TaxID=1055687 RepID=G0UA27_TRYVY|nr:hypothetical protein TVY486_1101430 [Trypanosoma vivax Y486]
MLFNTEACTASEQMKKKKKKKKKEENTRVLKCEMCRPSRRESKALVVRTLISPLWFVIAGFVELFLLCRSRFLPHHSVYLFIFLPSFRFPRRWFCFCFTPHVFCF